MITQVQRRSHPKEGRLHRQMVSLHCKTILGPLSFPPNLFSKLLTCTPKNTESPESNKGKKSTRVDPKAKLERSRQSARECRARKKLRYQYLEELVDKRQQAIHVLNNELKDLHEVVRKVDEGVLPQEALERLLDKTTLDNSGRSKPSTVTK